MRIFRRHQKVLGENRDGMLDLHLIYDMPKPFLQRECVIMRSVDIEGDHSSIITRTYIGADRREVRRHLLRVRMIIHLDGHYLERVSQYQTRII